MKKIIISASILIAGLVTNRVEAQSNIIKVNIISPFFKTGSVFYERKISGNKSAQLGLFYTGSEINRLDYKGFGITPEMRFYISGDQALAGFYIGPFLRYQHLKVSSDVDWHPIESDYRDRPYSTEDKLNTIGGGVVIGRQFIIKNHLSVDAFVGPQFNSGFETVYGKVGKYTLENGNLLGIGVRAGITVGVAF